MTAMTLRTLAVALIGAAAFAAEQAPAAAPPAAAQSPSAQPAPAAEPNAPKAAETKAKAPRSPSRTRRKTAPKNKPKATASKMDTETAGKDTPKPVLPSGAEAGLSGFGAQLRETESGLAVTGVLPGSPAESLGVLAGDALLHIGAKPVATKREASAAFRATPPQSRLSGVVRRGLKTIPLQARPAPLEPPFARLPGEFSAQEKSLQERRLAAALEKSEALVKDPPPMEFHIPAGQSLWVRIPAGIPAEAKPGDLVLAEATTPIPAGADLDFLALPPKTLLWGRLVEPPAHAEARLIHLYFFKLKAVGGAFYPVSARLADISGDQRLVKVSPGGILAMARREDLGPEARIKLEFLAPVALTEPPDYYQAGPGLWLKTEGDTLSVSKIIAGRSADRAGLKAGDRIVSIAGVKASKLDFASATSLLYGSRESDVKLEIIRADSAREKAESLSLERGVTYEAENSAPLPYPYEAKTIK